VTSPTAAAARAELHLGMVTMIVSGKISPMPFSLLRTIRFADTDAAGIVFFARYLAICHEAYEEALAVAGTPITKFFAARAVIVPIAKSEVSYLRPLACGDKVRIEVTPRRLSDHGFALDFIIWKQAAGAASGGEKKAAIARTEHICISSTNRERQALPAELAAWVDAG
jgi:1,4-dihydroxy-2-naphthoyl-CoA hydrolase